MSEAPLKATLKAGSDYAAPWLTVDGDNPDELNQKLLGVLNHPELVNNFIAASQALQGARAAGPAIQQTGAPAQPAPQAPPAQPQASGPWGGQNPNGQQQYQQQQGPALHPEGKSCAACGQVLQAATTRNGKRQWKCNLYRYNNGSPNEHTLEWVN